MLFSTEELVKRADVNQPFARDVIEAVITQEEKRTQTESVGDKKTRQQGRASSNWKDDGLHGTPTPLGAEQGQTGAEQAQRAGLGDRFGVEGGREIRIAEVGG